MNEFQATARSLLEHCVDYIRRDVDLERLRVTSDALSESAHVQIALAKDTWDEQARAIDHMIEIRLMFMDDVALSYEFVRAEDWVSGDAASVRSELVFAG